MSNVVAFYSPALPIMPNTLGGNQMSKLIKTMLILSWLSLLWIPLPSLTQAAGPGPQFKVQLETSKEIRALAVSPDGKYALTGLADHTLKLWDIARGKELRTFTGQTGPINSVAFSPDGKLGLSASEDATLRLWDLETGQQVRIFTGHKGPVNAAAFSPNGKYIISGSEDQTLILWDAISGEALVTLTGHTGSVLSVAISTDGKYALSGSADTTLKLWDLGDERELRTFTGHDCAVKFVAFLPGSRTAVSGSWPENHKQEEPWPDHSLKVWDIEARTILRTMTIQSYEHITSAAIAPDGNSVLLASYEEWDDTIGADYPERALELWDLNTGKVARSFGYDSLRAIAFSPQGNFVLAGGNDMRLTLWDSTGTEIKSFAGYTGTVRYITLSPDGQTLISVSTGTKDDQNLIRFWDTGAGVVKHDISTPNIIQSLAFSPNGNLALDNHLSLWDLSNYATIRTFTRPSEYDSHSVAISPDGKYALSGEDWEGYATKNTLTLWNLGNGQKIRTFTGHKGDITSVAFSPNGKFALSGATSNPEWQEVGPTLILWDLKTGKLLRNFQTYRENVNTIAFSPDGKWVISGLENHTIKLWDTKTGALVRSFTSHTGPINSVIFTHDGKWILSGAADTTIKLWDARNGKEIRTFTGHNRPVNSITVSPDNQYVISGSDDSTIRWWKIATGELVATLILKSDTKSLASDYLIWTPENFLAGSEAMIKDSVYLVDGWKVYSIQKLYNTFYRPDLVAAKLQGHDITVEAAKIDLSELVSANLTEQDLAPASNLGLTQPEITPASGTDISLETSAVRAVFSGVKFLTPQLLARFLRDRVFRESFQIMVLDNGITLNLTLFMIFLLIALFIGLLTCLLLWQALGINQGTVKPTGKIRWMAGWILIGIGIILAGLMVWGAIFKGLTTNLIFSITLLLIIIESGWLLRGFRPRKVINGRLGPSSEFQKKLILGCATFWGLLNLLILGQFLGFYELHPAINYDLDLYSFAFKNSSLVILLVLMLALLLFIYFGFRYISKVIRGQAEPAGKIRKIAGWIFIGLGAIFLGICLANLWVPFLLQTPITIGATLILLEAGWLTRGYQTKRLTYRSPWSAVTLGVIFMLFNLIFITAITFAFWDQDQKFIPINQIEISTATESATDLVKVSTAPISDTPSAGSKDEAGLEPINPNTGGVEDISPSKTP
jgi:WD40 repeat protein